MRTREQRAETRFLTKLFSGVLAVFLLLQMIPPALAAETEIGNTADLSQYEFTIDGSGASRTVASSNQFHSGNHTNTYYLDPSGYFLSYSSKNVTAEIDQDGTASIYNDNRGERKYVSFNSSTKQFGGGSSANITLLRRDVNDTDATHPIGQYKAVSEIVNGAGYLVAYRDTDGSCYLLDPDPANKTHTVHVAADLTPEPDPEPQPDPQPQPEPKPETPEGDGTIGNPYFVELWIKEILTMDPNRTLPTEKTFAFESTTVTDEDNADVVADTGKIATCAATAAVLPTPPSGGVQMSDCLLTCEIVGRKTHLYRPVTSKGSEKRAYIDPETPKGSNFVSPDYSGRYAVYIEESTSQPDTFAIYRDSKQGEYLAHGVPNTSAHAGDQFAGYGKNKHKGEPNNFTILMLRKGLETGNTVEDFVRVTDVSQMQDGRKYVIAYETSAGQWDVLYPNGDSHEYCNTLKMTGTPSDSDTSGGSGSGGTITFTAVYPGRATVQRGGKYYDVLVHGACIYSRMLNMVDGFELEYWVAPNDENEFTTDTKVVFTKTDGAGGVRKTEVPLAEAASRQNAYVFSYHVYAKEMTDEITATLYVDGRPIYTHVGTLADYCRKIIDDKRPTVSQTAKDACQAVLCVGGAMQRLKNYEISNLADKGMTQPQYTASNFEGYQNTQPSTEVAGVTYRGGSLILEDKLRMRLYFDTADAAGTTQPSITVTCDGCAVSGWQYDTGKGWWYVESEKLPAYAMDRHFTFAVSADGGAAGTVEFSVYGWCAAAAESAEREKNQALAAAIHSYQRAARAYAAEFQKSGQPA